MKKNKLTFIGIIASAFCLLIVQVYGIPNSMNIQGKLTNPAGTIQTGTFNFTFRVYDDFTGGNLLYETNITSTTDARGVYDIILKNINLNFTDQMYLAVKVNDDSEMQPRINLTSTPYTFRANVSEDLNKNNLYTVAGLNSTGNLSLKDKIVFGFGQFIDNLVNGWLRIESSLNVTGNVSIAQDTFFVDSGAGNVRISGSLDAVSYNIGWTNLSSYPPACGAGTFVTAVGDTISCASPSETSSAAAGWVNSSTITTTDLSVVVDSGTFYVNATTNNVGIGTSTPDTKLKVSGDINITGSVWSQGMNVTPPSGQIAAFNGTCPSGWSEVPAVRGRVIVGTPSGGTAGGEVGTALTDKGTRTVTAVPAHTHTVDPPSTASGTESATHTHTGPSHSHSIDPPATASGTESAAHTHTGPSHSHSVDPPNTGVSISDPGHTHTYNSAAGSGGYVQTYSSSGPGFNEYSTGSSATGISASVDIGSFSSGAEGTGGTGSESAAHTHTTDIGAFSSGAEGTGATGSASVAHTHTTDIGSFASGSTGDASVDVTMPYIQFTWCRKNPGSDYAEWIESNEKIEEKMIISVDPDNDNKVVKSKKNYDDTAIGIVSTAPGWIIGNQSQTTVKIALSGQVPVKATLANGKISRGDPITSSDIEGIGMKATRHGRIIGIALSELDYGNAGIYDCGTSKCGEINVLLDLTWYVSK